MPVAIHSVSLKPQVASSCCFCRRNMDALSDIKVCTNAGRSCGVTSPVGGGARLVHAIVD